jgi:hypothetical protein
MLSARRALMLLLFADRSPPSPRSLSPDLACCRPPPLLLFAVVVIHRCRCRHPPLPLSLSTTVVVPHRHLPPLQSSLPLRVSAVSCPPLLFVPFVVHRPILHAIVIRCCCCLPSPSSSAAAIFCRRSNHHHSIVTAVSHHLLSSFSIAVCRPITCVVVIRHSCYPPPLSSAVAVPPLVLPPTRC